MIHPGFVTDFFLLFWKTEFFLIILVISIIFFPILIYVTRRFSYKLGVSRQRIESNILKLINENLNGIKEMLLYRWDKPVKKNYSSLATEMVKVSSMHNSIQDISRYFIEVMGITLLIIFILILSNTGQIDDALVTLGVFGAAFFRLLPILNRISTFTQRLKFGMASSIKIDEFYNDQNKIIEIHEDFELKNNIMFENISYRFDEKSEPILKNLSFEIKTKGILGISGESGVGKTTLSNIIMGLIKPTEGKIIINNTNIIEKKLSIQKNIAFVPQNFFYADSSLINNITFFEKKDDMSQKKFESVIKNSNLKNFIDSLPDKEDTTIGEGSSKISGGQAQRIGIARALFVKSEFMIFDESTSSLDVYNEKEIIDTIYSLRNIKTIIIISHKKELLNKCDKVYQIKSKKIFQEHP